MERVAIFLAAVAPGLLVLAYGVAKTRSRWSNEALHTAFLVGAVGALGAGALEFGLEKLISLDAAAPLVRAGVTAVLFAAIPEEAIKFLILLGAAERHVDARRLQDIVVLALGVSLGFATLENLLYVVFASDWQSIAIGRSILAVPGHGIFGLSMGALLTSARLRTHRQRPVIVAALAVPMVLHAAYDFPLFALQGGYQPWIVAIWLAVLLLSAVLAIYLCNRVLPRAAEADRISGRDTTPPATARHLIVGGCVLLIAAPLLGVLLFRLVGVQLVSAGALISIFPAALGIDLIWTGFRRRKLASATLS